MNFQHFRAWCPPFFRYHFVNSFESNSRYDAKRSRPPNNRHPMFFWNSTPRHRNTWATNCHYPCSMNRAWSTVWKEPMTNNLPAKCAANSLMPAGFFPKRNDVVTPPQRDCRIAFRLPCMPCFSVHSNCFVNKPDDCHCYKNSVHCFHPFLLRSFTSMSILLLLVATV